MDKVQLINDKARMQIHEARKPVNGRYFPFMSVRVEEFHAFRESVELAVKALKLEVMRDPDNVECIATLARIEALFEKLEV